FDTTRTIDFTIRIVNHTTGPFVGELWVVPLAVVKDDYEPIRVKFSREDEEAEVGLALPAPILKPPLATGILLEFRRLRPEPPAPLASFKIEVRAAGLEVPDGLRVGYICSSSEDTGFGFGCSLRQALDQLGCKHELLTIENLMFVDGATDLRRFDSIV